MLACILAMSHIKGPEILDNCEEKSETVQKPLEAVRWIPEVAKILKREETVPSFSDFAAFLVIEGEVACSTVTSTYAQHSQEQSSDNRMQRVVFTTKTTS